MALLRTRQLIILLILTVCLVVARKHLRRAKKHRHRHRSRLTGALTCFNNRLYQENSCNFCVCIDGELLRCSRTTCDDAPFYREAKKCKIGKIWKESCNTCQCARYYGTVCTVRRTCLGSGEIDFGDPDDDRKGFSLPSPVIWVPLLKVINSSNAAKVNETNLVTDTIHTTDTDRVTEVSHTDRVSDVTTTDRVTAATDISKQITDVTDTDRVNVVTDVTKQITDVTDTNRVTVVTDVTKQITNATPVTDVKQVPDTSHAADASQSTTAQQSTDAPTESKDNRPADTADVTTDALASRMMLPYSFEDEYPLKMIKPKTRRILKGRLEQHQIRTPSRVENVETDI